jgi:hypothetical protein
LDVGDKVPVVHEARLKRLVAERAVPLLLPVGWIQVDAEVTGKAEAADEIAAEVTDVRAADEADEIGAELADEDAANEFADAVAKVDEMTVELTAEMRE